MKKLLLALAIALGIAGMAHHSAHAQTTSTAIMVKTPWARATPTQAKNGAVYFTIMNASKSADTLIGASTPAAATADLHRTTDDNGVMKMLPVKSVAVKAGGSVRFAPGGYHVMLMGLKAPLADGQTFPLTLEFQHAGKVEVTVPVMTRAPKGTPAPDMGKMKM